MLHLLIDVLNAGFGKSFCTPDVRPLLPYPLRSSYPFFAGRAFLRRVLKVHVGIRVPLAMEHNHTGVLRGDLLDHCPLCRVSPEEKETGYGKVKEAMRGQRTKENREKSC